MPRYSLRAAVDVTVLRSGVPDTLPGRLVNLCQRGAGAIVAGELSIGDVVGLELRLPEKPEVVRARAVVRYHDRLRCGMEFLGASAAREAAIREWAEESKAPLESGNDFVGIAPTPETARALYTQDVSGGKPPGCGPRHRQRAWVVVLVLMALASLFLWRWNRGWHELESGSDSQLKLRERPEAQVSAEAMQRLVVHRVEPEYPERARAAALRGIIVLDVIVGRDGTVVRVTPLNGPEVLARSAVNALRWWRFEPYRVDGRAVIVETTVAVEFKP